jgi:hypothetical protein
MFGEAAHYAGFRRKLIADPTFAVAPGGGHELSPFPGKVDVSPPGPNGAPEQGSDRRRDQGQGRPAPHVSASTS